MNKNRKQEINKNLEIIAKKEGITTGEVRNEIGRAISYALKSNDPKVQNFWKDIPCEGDSPTIEEIIDYIAAGLSKQK